MPKINAHQHRNFRAFKQKFLPLSPSEISASFARASDNACSCSCISSVNSSKIHILKPKESARILETDSLPSGFSSPFPFPEGLDD